jgi:tryptophan-rich sensory protein
MKVNKIGELLVSIILCEIVGVIGSIFTIPNIPTWYAALVKPFFSPPNWVFGPVWTILFFLMGVAVYLVWENKKNINQRNLAIAMFGVQFFFNILWSFLFFGLKSPVLGLIGIVLLWLSIASTILSFYVVCKKSAYLMIPYLLWVSFALILNLSIMLLN